MVMSCVVALPLSELRLTTAPPAGAGPDNVTVAVTDLPPLIFVFERDSVLIGDPVDADAWLEGADSPARLHAVTWKVNVRPGSRPDCVNCVVPAPTVVGGLNEPLPVR